jgi:hypothetical protein
VAFTVLLALFGLALIGFNYLETRKIALLGADDLLARIDAHMQTSVGELYGPVENVVDIASKALPAQGRSPEDGLRSLGFVSEVLRLMPEISSIFVGYENGDFYLLRHNEHVIQTIRMLGQLPFPRELRQVPDWAGNHHEKLYGTGYPRRLPADGLSVPERIMAMADFFEALTATDRPSMPPKTLSRAVGIMRSMCDSGHLCPDLFELFLRSGVYRRYAGQFLQPQQLDDVGALLGTERPMAS